MLSVVGNSHAATQAARRKPLSRTPSRLARHASPSESGEHGQKEGGNPRERRLSRTGTHRRLSRTSSIAQPGLFHSIEALHEQIPEPEHWIYSGRLQKRVVAQDISWQERLVVLTKDAIVLSRSDARSVGESIAVLEISSVVKVSSGDGAQGAFQEQQSRRRLMASMSAENTSKQLLSVRVPSCAHAHIFEIVTKKDGHFNGRTYSLRCESERDCEDWIEKINATRREAGDREEAANKTSRMQETWQKVQQSCHAAYHLRMLQWSMAVLVVFNFVIAIVEAERVPPKDSGEWWYFFHVELAFTAAFTLELLLNLFGHWFRPFWEDGFNVLDFIIVICSLVVIPLSDHAGFSILRLFRVFRIMRLFRLMGQLRVLMRALASSVVPVIYAFAVLFIVTCLYAVIGVQLFGARTPERFDRFSTAFFTMIQVCTGDGWAEAVARPMWDDYKGPQVSIFFVSYILIAGTFLLNIVVAVLLDEFITSVEKDKRLPMEEARLSQEEEFVKNESPLDPLVSTLTQYTSDEDLEKQIQDIFALLDPNEKGRLSCAELQDGLRQLPFEPPILLTPDDFEEITLRYQLCDGAQGHVDAAAFTVIMRMQLRRFVHKYLNLKSLDASQDNAWLILSLKQMLLTSAPTRPSSGVAAEDVVRMHAELRDLGSDVREIKEALKLATPWHHPVTLSGGREAPVALSLRSSGEFPRSKHRPPARVAASKTPSVAVSSPEASVRACGSAHWSPASTPRCSTDSAKREAGLGLALALEGSFNEDEDAAKEREKEADRRPNGSGGAEKSPSAVGGTRSLSERREEHGAALQGGGEEAHTTVRLQGRTRSEAGGGVHVPVQRAGPQPSAESGAVRGDGSLAGGEAALEGGQRGLVQEGSGARTLGRRREAELSDSSSSSKCVEVPGLQAMGSGGVGGWQEEGEEEAGRVLTGAREGGGGVPEVGLAGLQLNLDLAPVQRGGRCGAELRAVGEEVDLLPGGQGGQGGQGGRGAGGESGHRAGEGEGSGRETGAGAWLSPMLEEAWGDTRGEGRDVWRATQREADVAAPAPARQPASGGRGQAAAAAAVSVSAQLIVPELSAAVSSGRASASGRDAGPVAVPVAVSGESATA